MQPNISLNYNSQGRRGLLGMGWNLGGLSLIHRCAATISKDGFIDPIDFDSNDRFCLDGQPLLVVNGTYGAAGAEYRTEIDTFRKIISNGVSGSGPESFTVWTKSGEIIEYGFTVDSRINLPLAGAVPQDSAMYWLVNKISDRKSNYMTFTYFENTSTGENYPLKIEYTGNVSASITPYNIIEFEYENNAGDGFKFINGHLSYSTKRLSKIISKAEGVTLREYNLSYTTGQSTGRSRISAIQECDRNSNCMTPTLFEVSDNTNQLLSSVGQQDLIWGYNASVDSIKYISDYNGDGKADVIDCGILNLDVISVGTENGFYTATDGSFARDYCLYSGFHSNSTLSNRLFTMDVNGDGKTDMVGVGTGATKIGLSKRTTNAVEFEFVKNTYGETLNNSWFDPSYPGRVMAMDVNGDGWDDLVALATGTTLVALSNGTSFDPPIQSAETLNNSWFSTSYGGRVRQVDANGDGRGDIVAFGTGTTIVAISNGAGFDVTTGPEVFGNDYFDTFSSRVFDADVNGDGLVDFVALTDSYTEIAFNVGDGTFNPNISSTPVTFDSSYWDTPPYKNRIHVGDYNGDGKSDLFALGSPSYVAVSNGLAFNVVATTANVELDAFGSLAPVPYAQVMDVDGNGKTDIVWSDPLTPPTIKTRTWYSDEIVADQVTKITNGFGIDIEIEYQSLSSDASSYFRSDLNQSPLTLSEDRIFQGPLYVVNKTHTDDGVGGINTFSYGYTDAKMHRLGRGFLGFAQRTVSKSTSEKIESVITSFRQEFPYIGQIYESFSKITSITTGNIYEQLETSTFTISGTVGSGPVFPYVSNSVKSEKEGSFSTGGANTTVTEVTTYNFYDTYGNLRNHSVTTVDDTGTYTDYNINYYNSPDLGNWILGRLFRSATITNHNAIFSPIRFSDFEYDPQSGQLTKEILGKNTNYEFSKTYLYDNFGNITQVNVDGLDINARTETTTLYDPKGRYPISIKNAKNHEEMREYNDPHGLVTKVTGPNNLATSFHYDSLGRKALEIRPDGTTTTISYSLCGTCPTHTNSVPVYKITTTSPQTPTQVDYYDELNRIIISEHINFNGLPNVTYTEYDYDGRVARKSFPTIVYVSGTTPQYWTDYTYDAKSRVITENSSATGLTSYEFAGLLTTTTNALNQTTKEYKNSLGHTLWVEDADNNVTNYEYDSRSNLTKVTDPSGNSIINTYDVYGRKVTMNDPDLGAWKYTYNVLDQLTEQWDANTNHSGPPTVTMQYDDLGRMISRTEAEGNTTWVYDTASKGVGKLTSESAPNGFSRTFTYDQYGRSDSTTTVIGGTSYTVTKSYDIYSRVSEVTYPSGFQISHLYNTDGYLEKIVDSNNTSKEYWSKSNVNHFNQTTGAMHGNVFALKGYSGSTGRLFSSFAFGASMIQSLNYNHDTIGNLIERKDNLQTLTETLHYDDLNRLTQSDIAGIGTNTFNYDLLGNITSKSDVESGATYVYGVGNAGPHAVTSIGSKTYVYDDNGNMLSGDGRTITWSSYNKPIQITKGSSSSSFEYGPDRARYKHTLNTTSGNTTTTYIGNLYEKVETATITTDRNYIFAEGQAVAIYESRSNGTDDERYLFRDHLGSVDAIADENGNLIEKLSFDAFGKQRQVNWQAAVGIITSVITRGFTGHEMLRAVGLTHMNGRVYDALIGRFLSADPHIQYSKNLQNLNRYSYVLNNPLSYTDPSGFFIKGLLEKVTNAIGSVVSAIFKNNGNTALALFALTAAFLTGNFVLAHSSFTQLAAHVAAGAAGGFVGGFIGSGGSFKAGVIGALSGGALGAIGVKYNNVRPFSSRHVQKIALHGLVGGTANAARGGKFGRGFLTAGIAQAAAPGIDQIPGEGASLGRTVAAAVLGGAVSELSGGKFANGAVTGAYSRLFNDENSYETKLSRASHLAREALTQREYFEELTADQMRLHFWDLANKVDSVVLAAKRDLILRLDYLRHEYTEIVYDSVIVAGDISDSIPTPNPVDGLVNVIIGAAAVTPLIPYNTPFVRRQGLPGISCSSSKCNIVN